jgi:SAM-dependent methyltransferase
MTEPVDLFDSTYSHFTDQVLAAIRRETFGHDIGQNSWLTVEEYDRFISWLQLAPRHHVLEVACGSGGPALHLAGRTGCQVTGIDVSENGIATATESAARAGQAGQVRFKVADANARLPFEDAELDAIVCVDSMNHLADRPGVLREWQRVLRPGRRAIWTDPVVVTGPVTNHELAVRSSIGFFLFVPLGLNEELIANADLQLVRREDVTANAALVSGRWRDARHWHREELLQIEGDERFEGLQQFFAMVHRLTSERRLSRIAYLVEKRGR